MLSIGETQIIAGTCHFKNSSGTMYYKTRLLVLLNSQSADTDSSNVTETLQVQCTNDAYRTYGFTQVPTIQGVELPGALFDTDPINVWDTFAARTFDISHDENGNLTYTAAASFTTNASGSDYALASGECSESVTMAPIELNAVYLKIAGVWVKAIPYIKVAGEWKKAISYTKVAGEWKKTKV